MGRKALPIEIGQRYGRFVVQERLQKPGCAEYRCLCDCGAYAIKRATALIQGRTEFCRACRHDGGKGGPGVWKTHRKEYSAFCQIKTRIRHIPEYAHLWIAPEWDAQGGFEKFLADIGPAPADSPEWSVDRIDNNRGYEPGNVRWASIGTQARNRSCSPRHFIGERGLVIEDWARVAGMAGDTLRSRLKRGEQLLDAITTPTLAGRGARPPRDNAKAYLITACCEGLF